MALRRENGRLLLGYSLEGDLSGLRLPDFKALSRGERLWQHSCFEVFIAGADRSDYFEYNFAPSGSWAAYRLDGYRAGMRQLPDSAPKFSVRRAPESLTLDAAVSLPEGLPANLRIGLSAVIEDAAGKLSYWAMQHAPDKPDFHHPDAFALQLETS